METLVEQQVPVPALSADLSDRRQSADSTTSTDSDDMAPQTSAPASKQLLSADDASLSTGESSLSDARDSGVEADSFVPPDAETAARIAEAVEFYFSDENLLKDAFLLKHVKRNKEGYVSLKLLSSFKRVKHISRDWRVVAAAVRTSSALEVNEEGSKVRRLQPLPEHDETVTSRTVVAVNLPMESPTIVTVSALFGVCGDISSIRVLKPGQNVPVEVRAAFNKHPELEWENVNCAVVEFDLQEQAARAKETMVTEAMSIIPIGKVSNKKKSRQEEPRITAAILEEQKNSANDAASAEKKRRQKRKKNPLVHMESNSSMSGTDGDLTPARRLSSTSSGRPPLLPLPPGLRQHRMSPPSRPGGIFACTDIRLMMDHHLAKAGKSQSSPNVLPEQQAAGRTKKSNSFCGVVPMGADTCPWVARRKASGLSDADRRGSLMTHENVMREPRGPDGSKGFSRGQRATKKTSVTEAPVRKFSNGVPIKKASNTTAASVAAPAAAPSAAVAAKKPAATTFDLTAAISAPEFVPAALKQVAVTSLVDTPPPVAVSFPAPASTYVKVKRVSHAVKITAPTDEPAESSKDEAGKAAADEKAAPAAGATDAAPAAVSVVATAATPTEAPAGTPTEVPVSSPTVVAAAAPDATSTGSSAVDPAATSTAAPAASPTVAPAATPAVSPAAAPAVASAATPAATPAAAPAATPAAAPAATPAAVSAATPTAAPAATPAAAPAATQAAAPAATPTVTADAAPAAASAATATVPATDVAPAAATPSPAAAATTAVTAPAAAEKAIPLAPTSTAESA